MRIVLFYGDDNSSLFYYLIGVSVVEFVINGKVTRTYAGLTTNTVVYITNHFYLRITLFNIVFS